MAQPIQALLPNPTAMSQLQTSSNATAVSANAMDSQRKARRADWFRRLLNDLAMARGIVPTEEEEEWFIRRLHADGYDAIQADKASMWILYGDWDYRGKCPRLDYSDFFPSVEKIKRIVEARDMVVMTRSERTRLARLEARGIQGPANTDTNASTETLDGKNDISVLGEQFAKRAQAEIERDELAAKVEKLSDENRRLHSRIDRLLDRITVIESETTNTP